MLRIIVRTVDAGAAVHVGGPVHVTHKTFDVDLPEVEKYLIDKHSYADVEVAGVEVLEDKVAKEQ